MKLVLSLLRALRVVAMLLLLMLTILIYVVLETPYGIKLITTFVPLFLPFTLEIDNPRGAILDNLYADKVIYRDDVVDVEVTHGMLRLDLWRCFFHEVKIESAVVDNVSVTILDSGNPSTLTRAKLLHNMALPFSLNVASTDANHVVVTEEHQAHPWVDIYHAHTSALMNGEPHFTLRSQWQQGHIYLIPDLGLHTVHGAFAIDGHLPNYTVSFDSQLQHGNEEEKFTSIAGHGDFAGINLSHLTVRAGKEFVSSPMDITWLPYFEWHIPKITGKIQGYPVSGHLTMRKEDTHWQVDSSEIKIHDASLTASGQYDQQGQFDFNLAVPHLETLIAHSKGHIFATGQWQGSHAEPHLLATIDAGNIAIDNVATIKQLQGKIDAKSLYPIISNTYWTQFAVKSDVVANTVDIDGYGMSQAKLQFDGALDGQHAGTLNTQMSGIHLNDTTIDNININVQNKDFTQKANLAMSWDKKQISSTISGHYQQHTWQGLIESVQTNFNIALQKKSAVTINNDGIQINSICFAMSNANLCSDIHWQKDKNFAAHLNGKNIPISTITQFFSPSMKAMGTFSIAANITGNGQSIQNGKLALALSNGGISDTVGDTPIKMAFRASQFNVNLSQQGLSSNGELNILDQPPIRWQFLAPKFNLSDPNWPDTPISGSLQFVTRQLTPLTKLYPQFRNIRGALSANFKVNGTLSAPEIMGDLQFKEGQLDVPALGLHLVPVDFTMHAEKNKITYNGRVNTNPGLLIIQGYTDLIPNQMKTQLQISGNAVTVIHTSEYQVTAAPQLQLTWLNNLLSVEGQIVIPKARINPIDLGDTVTLSNDVVFVTGKEKKEKTHLPIRTRVKIILGDDIYLSVKGLTARLAGGVDVSENENSDQTTGVGQLNLINGRYKAHGENLNIRTGRAIFTGGSVTNPGLFVEAVRSVTAYVTTGGTPAATSSGQKTASQNVGALQSDVTVGARITGTVDAPQITFFSEPSGLTQSQILSYLVLGKGQSSGSDLDTALLLKAVSFLDIGGDETAATKNTLQKDLGLDEVGIQSQQEYDTQSQSLVNNTSLVLGKALSPKLFVDYSIGLIEPINILRIKYQLSQHFSVRSESNTNAQGVDVFYSIER